jgi:hypothetical protein
MAGVSPGFSITILLLVVVCCLDSDKPSEAVLLGGVFTEAPLQSWTFPSFIRKKMRRLDDMQVKATCAIVRRSHGLWTTVSKSVSGLLCFVCFILFGV